jgi:transposase InsO family protein
VPAKSINYDGRHADLNKTATNNRYFVVVIDHFTKYIEAFALLDTTAETVANTLVNEWFYRWGVPEQILSDQGKKFQSKLLDCVYDTLDIERLKTTRFRPQCDANLKKL